LRNGHLVVAFNRTFEKTNELAGHGPGGVTDVPDLMEWLPARRVVWLMPPAGQVPAIRDELLPQ
jgi:6-phosphogluconate dehydrogenase (decarboxylating)